MANLEKGDTATLKFASDDTHRRIFVGLGWDPNIVNSFKAKIASILGGAKTHHDLDLACHLYDTQGQALQVICAKEGQMVNQSGHIYHSGDDQEGFGLGDDEQISVELFNLSRQIHRIDFVATISSGHVFDDIDSPEIRLVDGYTGRNLQLTPLSGKQKAYLFLKLFRNESDGWDITFIDEYGKDYASIIARAES